MEGVDFLEIHADIIARFFCVQSQLLQSAASVALIGSCHILQAILYCYFHDEGKGFMPPAVIGLMAYEMTVPK